MGDYTVHFTTDPLDHILAGNLAYQKRTTARDPNAFTLLAQGQAPEILWIGCADSRIPKRLCVTASRERYLSIAISRIRCMRMI
ncbi:hypothetical protein CUC08_Gglean010227 [Alternaria sp. MG1]|nr:hypothetical protein CUC08_Gglean010227 [Alternaria sp. MG1]